jgi:anti-anti-sigma factor
LTELDQLPSVSGGSNREPGCARQQPPAPRPSGAEVSAHRRVLIDAITHSVRLSSTGSSGSPRERSAAALEDAVRLQILVRTATSGVLEVVAVHSSTTGSTVQAQGELDLVTAGLLAATLNDELEQGRRYVRLDLSRLDFVDGAGLRTLVRAHNRFLAARGTLVLTGLGPTLTRLLALTHLDGALFVAEGPRRARHLAAVPERPAP